MSAKKAQPSKKMVPLSEVGGALVSYAEEHASPQRASEVEAEVQKFIDALPDAAPTPALDAAHDRFLARAKKLVSADVYSQLEQAYRPSKAPTTKSDPYLTMSPAVVAAMRAYEARTYGGDVRQLLPTEANTASKRTKAPKKARPARKAPPAKAEARLDKFGRKPWYSVADAAKLLGKPVRSIRRRVTTGELYAVTVEGEAHIPLAAVWQALGLPPEITWSKKAKASQERADRRLYRRYRNDPERQEVAPTLVRLAREAETPAKKDRPLTEAEKRSVRVYAEILRRKGRSVADMQRLPAHPPWWRYWNWNEREQLSFERWFKSWSMRTLGMSAAAFEHDRRVWAATFCLHRRDICKDLGHPHDEKREADLPRAKWLPVKQAMVALPRDQWPAR